MTVTNLKLPIPPSSNVLFRNVPGKGRVKTGAYKAWLNSANDAVMSGGFYGKIEGPVELRYVVPENNRRDLGNYEKPLTDFLVSAGIIDGDRCKTVRKIVMEWGDVDEVHCYITEAK